jgi:fumarylacetoacetase
VIDHTHNRLASSWVPGADEHPDFPVQNLPLGVFSLNGGAARIGTAIGNLVLDLHAIAEMMPEATQDALRQPTLNALFALSPADRLALRHALFAKLTSLSCRLKLAPHLHAIGDCTLHLPFRIGDYTDFYVGLHHASNVGALFRPDNPLLPNYKHIPIGYHGRASSVRVSDAPCAARAARSNRPKPKRRSMPLPPSGLRTGTGRVDRGRECAGRHRTHRAGWDRIGGLCLLNDWSARDMQAWEYQPLGPFWPRAS